LIRDYFPENQRVSANAIYAQAIFIGNSVCALSTFIIDKQGWKSDFELAGMIGLILGVTGLLVLTTPERG